MHLTSTAQIDARGEHLVHPLGGCHLLLGCLQRVLAPMGVHALDLQLVLVVLEVFDWVSDVVY